MSPDPRVGGRSGSGVGENVAGERPEAGGGTRDPTPRRSSGGASIGRAALLLRRSPAGRPPRRPQGSCTGSAGGVTGASSPTLQTSGPTTSREEVCSWTPTTWTTSDRASAPTSCGPRSCTDGSRGTSKVRRPTATVAASWADGHLPRHSSRSVTQEVVSRVMSTLPRVLAAAE